MKMTGLRAAASGAALVAALAVVPYPGLTGPASAAGGSTPGVTVIATNPQGGPTGSDLALALTAHSARSALADPSCRPQDATSDCWGSLVLRIPRYGDLGVGGLEVHRVAVGDTSCGDTGGEDDGCGDETTAAVLPGDPVRAQVNGITAVRWPGNTGLAVGTQLQVKFTFTDNGKAPYGDTVVVQVSLFREGPKPVLYTSAVVPVRDVQIHYLGAGG